MVYRASPLRGLAVGQMVFGSLMIVFGAACIFSVDHWSSHAAFGIWVGVWVLIAGILGFVGAKDDARPNKCLIGCFMGFSITACVLAGAMFICYCVAVGDFAKTIRRCRSAYNGDSYNSDVYDPTSYPFYRTTKSWYYRYHCSRSQRYNASVGAGLGSCQLIISLVEFFIALASSIYCCNAVCCGVDSRSAPAAANQQVIYLQPQMYPGGQTGVVIMQPSGAMATVPHGAMATVPHGYTMAGQQAVFMPPQPVPAGQQPGYWAIPSGSNPAAAGTTVAMPYAGATAAPNQARALQQAMKQQERPPPYTYTQTGNAPPSVSASGAATSDDAPAPVAV